MYSRFYGFSEKPFDITPDPRFLYLSLSHREVLASLIYGIRERRGFIAVLGEAGTGKTTLLRSALDHVKENVRVAHIFNTDVTFSEMLQMILVDLGIASLKETLNKVEAFDRLNRLSIQQLSTGGNVVIMVDEAQNLDRGCLENLRLLSNLETPRHKLIQIVLSGQPELEEKLRQPDLRQLSQRINLRRYIFPLNENETREYIETRLKVAGYEGPLLFTRQAEKLLWRSSRGIPRIINTLCDNALLTGFALKERRIQEKTVKEVVDDLTRDRFRKGVGIPPETEPPVATLPEAGSRQSRTRFLSLVLLFVCISLLAGAAFGVLKSHWTANESRFFQNTMRVSIVPDAQKPFGGPETALKPQEETQIVADLKYTSEAGLSSETQASPVFFEDPRAPSPEMEETKAGSATGGISDPPVEENQDVSAIAKDGDTLHGIIVRFYGTYNKTLEQKVLMANPAIRNPNRIYVSQRIRMPGLMKGEQEKEG